ncbi:hypothetical protein [Mucilaginibacter sp.]|uniref:hypothetical protein n=1 Tax=Mucilaginibacter sp. TaxID=1882438 RepID=UPI003D0C2ABF
MKARFLFPYWCRFLGYACIVAHIPVMLIRKGLDFDPPGSPEGPELFNSHHLFFMTTTLLMLIGLILVAFAKEKIEDEQISQLRLDSLQWAVYLNYLILVITLAFTRTSDFWDIVHVNLWVPLVFFIVRFRWVIFRLNRSLKLEK